MTSTNVRAVAAVGAIVFLGMLAFPLHATAPGSPRSPSAGLLFDTLPAEHDLRLSIGRLAFDQGVVRLRVRLFWDDLQLALMEKTSDMEFRLADTEEVHRLVISYINEMLHVEGDGVRLIGHHTSHGIEDAPRADEVMWWYELAYEPSSEIQRLYLKNRLLFNLFEDQRNIVHVKMPSGQERAYYFSWAEEDVSFGVTRDDS